MTRACCGHEPTSGLYYETLGPDKGPPLLFIHGAGATGASWRATPDSRRGWADLLADQGHRCLVTDWPGTGRSGGRHGLEIDYTDLVAAYRAFLRDVVAEPVLVLCHSMGGAITWQLVAHESDLVRGVVSVAGAYPGNLVPRSEVIDTDAGVVEVVFADTGVRFRVDPTQPYLYEEAYISGQAIATSTRFPPDAHARLRAGFVGIPPRVLLQRLGVLEGLPSVTDPAGFQGKRIRLVAGSEDPAHTREIEERTVAQLREWGADARLTWLADIGIEGNGHFPFFEINSDEVLTVVASLVEELLA